MCACITLVNLRYRRATTSNYARKEWKMKGLTYICTQECNFPCSNPGFFSPAKTLLTALCRVGLSTIVATANIYMHQQHHVELLKKIDSIT